MHSIVILGDVRYHNVRIEAEKWKDQKFATKFEASSFDVVLPGGALMMVCAIKQMARECNLWLTRNVDDDEVFDLGKIEQMIYSFQFAATSSDFYGELHNWKLVPHELAGADNPKARLLGQMDHIRSKRAPQIPRSFRTLLGAPAKKNGEIGKRGWFAEVDEESSNLNSCPDVTVFDDLDVFFAGIKFTRSLDNAKETHIERYRATLRGNTANPTNVQRAVLGSLFDRFHRARKESLATNSSILGPVIIGSIRKKPGRVFYERWEEDKQRTGSFQSEKTAWLHLLDDHWLRRRVIILLDAQDLRDDGLSISTGLSWERTAQDTISQIRHSPTYRQFLQFGHVIIRYGVTGALHIACSDFENNRSYTLFFDPGNDDTHWDLAHRDGTVLGDTSVYAAHLVKALQQECRKHSGFPELIRLGAVVRHGLTEAIKSSQLLSRTSYGDGDWAQFYKAVQPTGDSVHNLFPSGIFCHNSSQGCTDRSERVWCVNTNEVTKKQVPVVSASIPPSLQRQWSILMQSAMVGEMEHIAQQIVVYGATEVFNYDLNDSFSQVRDALTQLLIDVVYENRHRLQDEAGAFDEESIKERWIRLCDEAVHRLNESEKAPKNLEKKRSLEIPSSTAAFRDAWQILQPTIDVFENDTLWHHFNSPDMDGVFEQLLVFRPHPTEFKYKDKFTGFSRSLQSDPIITPMVKYGKSTSPLYIVDRREVEGYRAIERLMKQHLNQVKEGTNKRPLCIALFGPPGSGKSFAVKAINYAINESFLNTTVLSIKVLSAYNLGQYTSVDDLQKAFKEIESEINDPDAKKEGTLVIPIAFFDEFDSNYEKEELGWLKFFLAPMEDGEFRGFNIRDAILVFAGGTRQTFDEFSMAKRPPTDEQWIQFSKAKGPDFASRLTGHLDIVGINTTGAEDELFMIRRSLLIRSMLGGLQNLQEGDEADIDAKMIRALLKVPHFRNGGRSIRTLLDLCRDQAGRVSASEIPPIHQLNMHVEGKAFLDLLHERKGE